MQKGQSLKSIAAGYQTSSTMLASMNNLSVNSGLREGQVLTVPAAKDTVFNPHLRPSREYDYDSRGRSRSGSRGRYGRGKHVVHTIEVGETLSEIAEAYGVSTDSLRKCNGLKSSTSIFYGDTLWICGSTKKPSAPSKPEVAKITGPTRTVQYTVRQGDRCYFIARYYGIHSQDIISRNKLDPQCSIRPGQTLTLVVPKDAPTSLPPTGELACADPAPASSAHSSAARAPVYGPPAPGKGAFTYTVKQGESLWLIAKKFDAHVDDIKLMNKLTSDSVRPGQEIVVKPGSEFRGAAPGPPVKNNSSKPAPPPKNNNSRPPANGAPPKKCSRPVTHTVQPGESLWAIAKHYDAYSVDIKAMNELDSDALRPGLKLNVCPGSEYKSGAKSSSASSAGPASNSSSSSVKGKKKTVHTVKQGESLWQIAHDHDIHIADIKQWNHLSSDSLHPGQKLIIYQ